MRDAEFYLSEEEGEVLNLTEIMFRDIEDINTLSIEDDIALISACVYTEISMDLSVFDEENSYWDKEDGRYLFVNYNKYSHNFNEWIYFEASISINDSVQDVDIEIININENKPFMIDTIEHIY